MQRRVSSRGTGAIVRTVPRRRALGGRVVYPSAGRGCPCGLRPAEQRVVGVGSMGTRQQPARRRSVRTVPAKERTRAEGSGADPDVSAQTSVVSRSERGSGSRRANEPRSTQEWRTASAGRSARAWRTAASTMAECNTPINGGGTALSCRATIVPARDRQASARASMGLFTVEGVAVGREPTPGVGVEVP